MIKLNKKYLSIIFFIFSFILLFVFQKTNFNVVKDTTTLFVESVFPSLFPFILLTNILIASDVIYKIPANLSILLTGFICGYPMGAKLTQEYLDKKIISKEKASFFMSFCNNANPIFITSTIGLSIFGNIKIGIILLLSQYISALIIGISYFLHNNIIHEIDIKSKKKNKKEIKILHKSSFDIVNSAIISSFKVSINIFSFILIFNMLFKIIEIILIRFNANKEIIYIFSCIFETTGGIKKLYLNSNFNLIYKIAISSFALGFSGISIIFQIYSQIYKNVSLIPIIKYKLIQGIISFIITFTTLNLSNISLNNSSKITSITPSFSFLITVTLFFLFACLIKKVTQK